jgi:hypothetical protein
MRIFIKMLVFKSGENGVTSFVNFLEFIRLTSFPWGIRKFLEFIRITPALPGTARHIVPEAKRRWRDVRARCTCSLVRVIRIDEFLTLLSL